MDYRKEIQKVDTIISKGKMRIRFWVEGWKQPVYTDYKIVKNQVDVHVTELEILTGSILEFSFFKPGEIVENGKPYGEGYYKMTKELKIHSKTSLEDLRIKNSHLLKDFVKIKEVFTFIKWGKAQVGIKSESLKKYYFSPKMLSGLTKLRPTFYSLLTGTYFYPEYYQEGEIIYNGDVCKKGGTLLKNLALRYPFDLDLQDEFIIKDKNSITSEIRPRKSYYLEQYEVEQAYKASQARQYVDGKSFDDWLVDAAGTDDPKVMNDVYWNLD